MFNKSWREEFLPLGPGGQAGFRSRSGHILIEVKRDIRSIQVLLSALSRLAMAVNEEQGILWGCLVLEQCRITPRRLLEEWRRFGRLLSDGVRSRLCLIANTDDGRIVEPSEEQTQQVADLYFRDVASSEPAPSGLAKLPSHGEKYAETAKVLLARWLWKHPPLQVHELSRIVGCSYPTIRASLTTLEREGLIQRTSNRAVYVSGFPQALKTRLVALRPSLQPAVAFQDVSGTGADYERLKLRLNRLKPQGVAFGGVVAARVWQPDFQLNGTPRLQLIAEKKVWRTDLKFVAKLDPALRQVVRPGDPVDVVVHLLNRGDSMFHSADNNELPIADPIETWLDLQQLGLIELAEELIQTLAA